jgi:tetratricopeptide (TPR) repeat protein
LREAQALARLQHPNVVTVFDVGSVGGDVFVAMELVDGDTLGAWLRARERTWREIVAAFVAAANGLTAAHAAGIVHRDFKPGNVLVGRDGRVRVMDFGLARSADDSVARATDLLPSSNALGSDLTATGTVLGTPLYMPPEAFRGDITGEAGDQFSFCVALYRALYGDPPFPDDISPQQDAHWVAREPKRGGVPRWLWPVIARGLSRSPSARHASMATLVTALSSDPRRRRLGFAAVAVIAITGASVYGVHRVQHARAVAACEAAGDSVDDVWNAERSAAIAKAFANSGLPYAPETWKRSTTRLDAYASSWRRARTAACTRDDGLPEELAPASVECLDDLRDGVDALLGELATPEATLVQKTAAEVASLPAVETCADPVRLRHEAQPPVAVQPIVRCLRTQLARSKAALAAGQGPRALDRARSVLERAQAIAWPPLTIDAELATANAYDNVAKYDDARRTYEDAFFAAGSAGRDDLALAAATSLVRTLGTSLAKYDQGLWWGRVARMFENRLEPNELAHASLLFAIATVRNQNGEHREAIEMMKQALATQERIFGPIDIHVAQSLGFLGRVYVQNNEFDLADQTLARAVATSEQVLGRDHPVVGQLLRAQASALTMHGESDKGLALAKRALSVLETALGPRHPSVGDALTTIGNNYVLRYQHAEALPYYQRALSIAEEVHGTNHPGVAVVLNNLGGAYEGLEDHAKALAMYERALAVDETVFGPDHENIADAARRVGEQQRSLGRISDARASLDRALAVAVKRNIEPALVAVVQRDIGDTLVAQANYAEAIPRFEQALAMQERDGEPASWNATTRVTLAKALWDSGRDRARARQLMTEARDAFAAMNANAGAKQVATANAWLASHPGHR